VSRVIAAGLLLALLACRAVEQAVPAEPQARYDLAEKEKKADHLDRALALAQAGMQDWDANAAPPWHWAFGYLCADIHNRMGAPDQARALLAIDFPLRDQFPDLELDRLWLNALISEKSAAGAEVQALLEQGYQFARRHGRNERLLRFFARKVRLRADSGDIGPQVQADYRTLAGLAEEFDDLNFRAFALDNLGYCLLQNHHYHQALDVFEKALTLDLPFYRGSALLNLGVCYGRLGYYQKALDCLEESLTANGDHPERVQGALGEIGNIYFFQAEMVKAQQYYRQALELTEKIRHEHAVKWLGNLATTYVERQDWDQAEHYNQRAYALVNDEARPHLDLNAGYIALGRADLKTAEQIFERVSQSNDTSLQWSSQAGMGRVRLMKGDPGGANAHFEQACRIIEDDTAMLTDPEMGIMFFARMIRFYQEYVQILVDQNESDRALQVVEHSRARIRSWSQGGGPVTVAELVALARRTKGVYLAYWLAPEKSYLWVIGAAGAGVTRFDLPGAAAISSRVARYRQLIENQSDPLAFRDQDGAWLFETLIPTALRADLTGRNLVVVPDQALCGLNFETLPVYAGDQARYWIEVVSSVAVAPSLAVIAGAGPPVAALSGESALLVMGDPEEVDAAAFPALKSADREIQSLAQSFPRNRLLTGAQACPEAYAAANPGLYRLIHFAAHVEPNGAQPLYSAVVLSRCSDAGYKLYARDILSTPLEAQLVTVSSCQSSGTPRPGEGLVGLAWAFLHAGAHNVVAALWNVNDKVAPKLMDAFYEDLARGQAPVGALHRAKIGLIRGAGATNYHKPYYWAPFQVYIGKSR